MELKDLLLKTSPELSSQEKDFIKEHQAELGNEDLEAYADFLTTPDAVGETPVETGEVPSETPKETTVPAVETEQVKPAFSFTSEEEAKEFVRKQTEENEKQKQAAMDAAKTPEERKYIDENWKPENWLEAKKQLFGEFKEELAKEEQVKAEKAAVKFWEDQWTELSKEKSLKPLNTEEGKTVHNQIINIMRAYNLPTFKEGYDMREKFEAVRTGATPPPTPSEAGAALAKARGDAQKKAATKVGAANAGEVKPGNATGVKPFASYEELKRASSRGILKDL